MAVSGPQQRRGASPTSWSTLAAYQEGDPRRQASREVLFGSDWYTRQDQPPWRAVWVQATGEFIVVCLAGTHEADHGPVRLLGTFPDLGVLEVGFAPGRRWRGGLARWRGWSTASRNSSRLP
jgi:hypothetical protein